MGSKLGTRHGYTMTPEVRELRKASAKLSRPGARADTEAEAKRRMLADKIGRRLSFEIMRDVDSMLKANREIVRRLDAMFGDPSASAEGIAALASQRLQAGELSTLMREIQNRWGQPPRSVLEVEGADRPPVMVMASFGQWESREESHAADAGNGAAHGNGSTQH